MYKVGDKVLVKSEKDLKKSSTREGVGYCRFVFKGDMIFNSEMIEFCDSVVTVKEVHKYRDEVTYKIEEGEWNWIDEFFIGKFNSKLDEYTFKRNKYLNELANEVTRISEIVQDSELVQEELIRKIQDLNQKIEEILKNNKN